MSSSEFYDSELISKAYLGKKAADLANLITAQAEAVYRDRGMTFPVVTSSTLHYLGRNGGVSLVDIAKALEHPHQVIAQRIANLARLGLVERHPDPDDGRRQLLHLTDQGRDQAGRLEDYIIASSTAVQDLFDEIHADLSKTIGHAIAALKAQPFGARFPDS